MNTKDLDLMARELLDQVSKGRNPEALRTAAAVLQALALVEIAKGVEVLEALSDEEVP